MRLATVFILCLLAVPALAQAGDCTKLSPCGPVPWSMPNLPRLLTPTAVPNSGSTVNAIFGPTPVPALDGSASLGDTSFFNGGALNDQIGTLTELMSNENTLEGTGQDLGVLVGQSGDFFGYVRAFSVANFGVFTPILVIAIISFGIKLNVGIGTRLFPVMLALYGFVRKAITVILDFIPL
jgi:hypothetical protein